jgi:hypothetical protein
MHPATSRCYGKQPVTGHISNLQSSYLAQAKVDELDGGQLQAAIQTRDHYVVQAQVPVAIARIDSASVHEVPTLSRHVKDGSVHLMQQITFWIDHVLALRDTLTTTMTGVAHFPL